MQRKITSVIDLSRYKVGDYAWWVTLRYKEDLEDLPNLPEHQKWMDSESIHPKILYERGPYNWPYHANLPKLPHFEFMATVGFLTHRYVVERFEICEVTRSSDTGEFYYSNQDNDWMPESYLMDTDTAAHHECNRVIKMIQRWAKNLVNK